MFGRATAGVLALALGLGSSVVRVSASPVVGPAPMSRLEKIVERGRLECALAPRSPGFSVVLPSGDAEGLDADLCRAIAITIFGAPGHVTFVPVETIDDFLSEEDADLVFHGLTWKIEREMTWRVRFGPVTFLDGQGFLVPEASPARKSDDLAGKRICVEGSTRWEAALLEWSRTRRIPVTLHVFPTLAAARAALAAGECEAVTADSSVLIGAPEAPSVLRLLPDRITQEPLAPVTRAEDWELQRLVDWTIHGLIGAEAAGLTARSAATMVQASPGAAERSAPGQGKLADDWIFRLVAEVGNYGEIYGRNLLGAGRVRHERGSNRPWSAGGLLSAPPWEGRGEARLTIAPTVSTDAPPPNGVH